MNIIKHVLLWTVILVITALVFLKLKEPSQKQWQTYQKENKTLSSHPSTKEEMRKAKVTADAPQLQPPPPSNQIDRYQGRKVINSEKIDLDWSQLEFANRIDPDWKEYLAQRLLRKYDDEAKVLIRHKESLIKIIKGRPHYFEVVIISFLKENGRRHSYSAYINSESGKVEKTWGRTRYEDLPSRKRIN